MECPHCGLQLPLRLPENGLPDRWECLNCGGHVLGKFDPGARPSIRDNCEPDFTGEPLRGTEPVR